MRQKQYDFHLPQELLAAEPAKPRDTSRIFVYDSARDSVQFDSFFNIDKYLPPQSTLVLNKTRVAASRITLAKPTGGKIVCLFLLNEKMEDRCHIRVMVDRKIEVGEVLTFSDSSRASEDIITCLSHDEDSIFMFKLHMSRVALFQLLDEHGTMPIPLYLRHTSLATDELREQYQTVYAQSLTESTHADREDIASVAAPTAGLHFTQKVFQALKQKDMNIAEVFLEVGMGTFAPLSDEALQEGKLHVELYQVPEPSGKLISRVRSEGSQLVAVGTTVVRALESFAQLVNTGSAEFNTYHPTDIFIKPGHIFKLVDCLVTNFHLPNSSLIMLVDALLQHKGSKRNVIDLYQIAIQEKFRFYSFGDSMVIL